MWKFVTRSNLQHSYRIKGMDRTDCSGNDDGHHSHKGQGYVKIAPGKGLDRSYQGGISSHCFILVPSPQLLTLVLVSRLSSEQSSETSFAETKRYTSKSESNEFSTICIQTLPLFASMGQNAINGLQRKSWNNLHALNEWRIVLINYHTFVIPSKSLANRPSSSEAEENMCGKNFEENRRYSVTPLMPNHLIISVHKWNQVDFRIN